MRYYPYNEDWISHLDGDFRVSLIETLRGLRLDRLQRYPPPKLSGLPLGNEPRIFTRFVRGKSSQLDASAFSGLYRKLLSKEEELVYRAFRTNDFLSRQEWDRLIGPENAAAWIGNKCLYADRDGKLRCEFSIVSIDGVLFASDQLKDHGKTWEPPFLIEDPNEGGDADVRPYHHAYMGLDSLRMIERMDEGGAGRGDRYLDCGTGSGSILLFFSRRYRESVGIDLNERAARLAGFNAELNGLQGVSTATEDALLLGDRYGRFDLVSWNLPFIFMPDEMKDDFIDAFGGHLGIELCLKFIQTLPGLLTDTGSACIAAIAPILGGGENVLETKLRELLPKLGLDCDLRVEQLFTAASSDLREFHRSHGIAKFESVYLWITPGKGGLSRTEAPLTRRAIDRIRDILYRRRFD